MLSSSDLQNFHLDTDNFMRRLDDVMQNATPRGKEQPRLDAKAAQQQLADLAKQIQGQSLTAKDNDELKLLNNLTADFNSSKPFGATLNKFRRGYDEFKNKGRNAFFKAEQAKVQLADDLRQQLNDTQKEVKKNQSEVTAAEKDFAKTAAEPNQFKALSDSAAKSLNNRNAKIKTLYNRLAKEKLSLDDLNKIQQEIKTEADGNKSELASFKTNSRKIIQQAAAPKNEAAKKDEEEEGTEEKPEIKEAEKTEAGTATRAQTAKTRTAGRTVEGTPAGSVTVKTTRTAGATAAVAAPVAAATTQTAEVTVTATAQAQTAATQSAAAEVTVSAQSKIERAAAARGISATATPAVNINVTATAMALTDGAAQAVQWMQAHQTLTSEQITTQAFHEINTRSARETQASFSSPQELSRTRAQNRGFAHGLTSALQSRAALTGDAGWSRAAANVSAFAQTTAAQTAASGGMPGLESQAAPSIQELDDQWEHLSASGSVPSAAPSRPPVAKTTLSQSGRPSRTATAPAASSRAPRPTPRAANLPPGVTLKKEPLHLPAGAMAGSSNETGTTFSEGPGGDTVLSEQSIGAGSEQPRTSVLEEFAPSSKSLYQDQIENVPPPMAGEELTEEAEKMGGGEMVTNQAMELQSRRIQEQMLAAQQSLIPQEPLGLGTNNQVRMQSRANVAEDEDDEDQGQNQATSARSQNPVERAKQLQEDIDKAKKYYNKGKDLLKGGKNAAKAGQEAAKGAQTAVRAGSSGARVTTELAEGITSEAVVPLIIMFVQMNLQLILKYLLKGAEELTGEKLEEAGGIAGEQAQTGIKWSKEFLNQSLAEDFFVICLDCNVFTASCPCMWFVVLALLALVLVILGTAAAVSPDLQSLLLRMMGISS